MKFYNTDNLPVPPGMAQEGDKVVYLGINGYDIQRDHVELLGVSRGDRLTVSSVEVGSYSSSYTFEEIKGLHNTVMFELVPEPSTISIEWLDDQYECEDCGYSYATGARVKLNGEEILLLEPVAHCYGGDNFSTTDVYYQILNKLGYKVIEE